MNLIEFNSFIKSQKEKVNGYNPENSCSYVPNGLFFERTKLTGLSNGFALGRLDQDTVLVGPIEVKNQIFGELIYECLYMIFIDK